jgi:hypothetical protein
MEEDKDIAELRKKIREELAEEPRRPDFSVKIIFIIAMAALVPPLLLIAYLVETGAFGELGEFFGWLFDCMGAKCP